MKTFKLFFFPILIAILLSVSAHANQSSNLPIVKTALDFSVEDINISPNESMGLLGGNYLFSANKHVSAGLGVYGAVTGVRGGFFTGGLQTAWRQTLISNIYFNAQFFVGGGGGGAAPQGGGLMLRVFAGLGYAFQDSSFSLGLSHISFPNGDIESRQFTLSYAKQFKALYFPGWYHTKQQLDSWESNLRLLTQSRSQELSLQYLGYFPSENNKGRSGKVLNKRMDVLGIRWSQNYQGNYWVEFETNGAMGGSIDGFAQVFAGLAYKLKVQKYLRWSSGLLLGAAGGGDVDTGGGVVTRVFTGIDLTLNPRWSVYNHAGLVYAPDSDLLMPTFNINLAYHFHGLNTLNVQKKLLESNDNRIQWRKFRLRSGVQRYSHMNQASRKNPEVEEDAVNLVSLKIDAFMNNLFFISGQAISAFTGGAGGYAVGLLGPGFQFSRHFSAELLAGVAGGGGLAVGAGKILQPMLNLNVPINNSWGCELSLGYIDAIEGDMKALVSNISLNYHFTKPYY